MARKRAGASEHHRATHKITTNDDVISEENLPIFIKQEAETNANTKTDLSLAAAMEKQLRN